MTLDELQAELAAMVRAHAGTGAVAAFDWDDTCIAGDLGLSILRSLDAENGTNVMKRYQWLCENAGIDVGYPYCTTVHAGSTRAELSALAKRVWSEATADGRITPRPWVRDLMDAMREAHWQVWVVSANPKAFVETAAATYDVPADNVIAMELRSDDDGVLLPWLVEPAPCGDKKVPALLAHTGTPVFAATDSIADRALLEAADHALAIPVHDDGLRELAAERGWWCLDAE